MIIIILACIRTSLESYFCLSLNIVLFIMRLSQFCKNELQAQYSITYQAQYIAKKYMLIKTTTTTNKQTNKNTIQLSLAMNVRYSVRICYDFLYVHTCLLMVFDVMFLSGDLQQCSSILSMILGVYFRLLIRVSLSLSVSLCIPLLVFGYIVTDCT